MTDTVIMHDVLEYIALLAELLPVCTLYALRAREWREAYNVKRVVCYLRTPGYYIMFMIKIRRNYRLSAAH